MIKAPQSVVLLITILVCFLVSECAIADVVYLKNGGRVKGTVISESSKDVVIDIGGGTATHSRRDVMRIDRSDSVGRNKAIRSGNMEHRIMAPKPKVSILEVVKSMSDMIGSVLRLDFLKKAK